MFGEKQMKIGDVVMFNVEKPFPVYGEKVSHGIGVVVCTGGSWSSQPIGIELAPDVARWFGIDELEVL
jgi:hypothetical protein